MSMNEESPSVLAKGQRVSDHTAKGRGEGVILSVVEDASTPFAPPITYTVDWEGGVVETHVSPAEVRPV